MTARCRLLLVVAMILLVQVEADIRGRISINFHTYSKSTTAGCTGSRGPVCQPQFDVCMNTTNNVIRCYSHQFESSKDLPPIEAHGIYFKRFNDTSNSMEYYIYTDEHVLLINVSDHNDLGMQADLATFRIDVTELEPTGSRDLRFHSNETDVYLDVSVTLRCISGTRYGYYGRGCAVYCESNLRYECRTDGSRRCSRGYFGSDCDQQRSQNNSCYSNPCVVGTCYTTGNNDYFCHCPDEFYGHNCEHHFSTPSTANISTSCNSSPCYKGVCYHIDRNDYMCNCSYGYEGKDCDQITTFTSHTTPRNPCYYSNPCYRGTCYAISEYDYHCNCPYGFQGKRCDEHISSTKRTESPSTPMNTCHFAHCENNGTCVPEDNDYHCSCLQGYSGKYCERDPCYNKHCLHGGVCHVTNGSGICVCPIFYKGDLCQNNPCLGFSCYNGGTCTFCEIKNICQHDSCLNNGTCSATRTGIVCSYPPGFSGTRCEHAPVHTDYCATAHCHHHGTCINTVSNFLCKCRPGFSGHRCQNVDACSGNPCQNGGTCKAGVTGFVCDCQVGYTGHNCDVVNGCGTTVKNCRQMQCPVNISAQCIECHDGFDLVSGVCVECPSIVSILHCEKEARAGCLFRHCEQCETGFFPLGSGCDVCPDVDIGCREVNCTSYTDALCTSCHPGFYPVGDTCAECAAPISNYGEVDCSYNMDARCLACRDGYIFYKDTCVLCPSQEVIPDCLDVGRAGCFDKWCRKCASGFYLRGTVCDVCPNLDVGCEHAQCNSTHDAHCVQCHHGYGLQNNICVRSHNGSPTPSSDVCTDSPNTDCSYLHSTIRLCDDTTRACQYCPRYCGMCDTCKHVQSIPVIG